jgi:hypothetical protein
MNEEIDIFKCLDYIRDNAKKYAQAKANRVYLEEYRKSLKATLMATQVGEPVNAREIYAYAHHDYTRLLEGIKEAIAEEENLRWKLIAAQAKIEVFRTLEANKRIEAKVL